MGNIEWVTGCSLMQSDQLFSAISWQEQVTFQWCLPCTQLTHLPLVWEL